MKMKRRGKHPSIEGKEKGEIFSLASAYHLTQRASQLGFDWPDLKGVLKKLDEELKEFQEAISMRNRKRIREELGDLFFVLVNISRFLRINPEKALRKTIEKFTSRFRYIEISLQKEGKTFHQSNLKEMDQLWEEAKRRRQRPSKGVLKTYFKTEQKCPDARRPKT